MDLLAFAKVDNHHILAWLVIGLVAGLLASLLVRGGGLGLVRDVIVGLIGAVIGGLVMHALRHSGPNSLPKLWQEVVVAFLGAVILLLIIKLFTRRGRDAY